VVDIYTCGCHHRSFVGARLLPVLLPVRRSFLAHAFLHEISDFLHFVYLHPLIQTASELWWLSGGFSVRSQEIGLEERLRNDLFCAELDVKP